MRPKTVLILLIILLLIGAAVADAKGKSGGGKSGGSSKGSSSSKSIVKAASMKDTAAKATSAAAVPTVHATAKKVVKKIDLDNDTDDIDDPPATPSLPVIIGIGAFIAAWRLRRMSQRC